jgi:hypothetical protein
MAKDNDSRPGFFGAVIKIFIGLTVAALAFAYFFDTIVLPAQPQLAAHAKVWQYDAAKRLLNAL